MREMEDMLLKAVKFRTFVDRETGRVSCRWQQHGNEYGTFVELGIPYKPEHVNEAIELLREEVLDVLTKAKVDGIYA